LLLMIVPEATFPSRLPIDLQDETLRADLLVL
jgi:hypothetical protein